MNKTILSLLLLTLTLSITPLQACQKCIRDFKKRRCLIEKKINFTINKPRHFPDDIYQYYYLIGMCNENQDSYVIAKHRHGKRHYKKSDKKRKRSYRLYRKR